MRRAQAFLQADEVEEPDGPREIDDEVDVGILPCVAAHDGAEAYNSRERAPTGLPGSPSLPATIPRRHVSADVFAIEPEPTK